MTIYQMKQKHLADGCVVRCDGQTHTVLTTTEQAHDHHNGYTYPCWCARATPAQLATFTEATP